MKRYFFPLLLASACLAGHSGKVWGMETADTASKAPIKGKQYPLTGQALHDAITYALKLPEIRDPNKRIREINDKEYGLSSQEKELKDFCANFKNATDLLNNLKENIFSISYFKTQEELDKYFKKTPLSLEHIAEDLKNSNEKIEKLHFLIKAMDNNKNEIEALLGKKSLLAKSDHELIKHQYLLQALLNRTDIFVKIFSIIGTDFKTWTAEELENFEDISRKILPISVLPSSLAMEVPFSPGFDNLQNTIIDIQYARIKLLKEEEKETKPKRILQFARKHLNIGQRVEVLNCLLQESPQFAQENVKDLFNYAYEELSQESLLFFANDALKNPDLEDATITWLRKNITTGLSLLQNQPFWNFFIELKQKDLKEFFKPKEGPFSKHFTSKQGDGKLDLTHTTTQDSLYQIAFLLEKIAVGPKDDNYKKAIKLYEKLAEKEHYDSRVRLVIHEISITDFEKSPDKALELIDLLETAYGERAEKNPELAFILGDAYSRLKKSQESLFWFEQAAQMGHQPAIEVLKEQEGVTEKSIEPEKIKEEEAKIEEAPFPKPVGKKSKDDQSLMSFATGNITNSKYSRKDDHTQDDFDDLPVNPWGQYRKILDQAKKEREQSRKKPQSAEEIKREQEKQSLLRLLKERIEEVMSKDPEQELDRQEWSKTITEIAEMTQNLKTLGNGYTPIELIVPKKQGSHNNFVFTVINYEEKNPEKRFAKFSKDQIHKGTTHDNVHYSLKKKANAALEGVLLTWINSQIE